MRTQRIRSTPIRPPAPSWWKWQRRREIASDIVTLPLALLWNVFALTVNILMSPLGFPILFFFMVLVVVGKLLDTLAGH